MPTGKAHSRQTSKQAKKEFKARGSTNISEAEKRRLERGAELLDRAARAKAQEQRKREWQKRREEQERERALEARNVDLGSQVRLDKFGYKSSQYHLGSFFGRSAQKLAEEPAKAPTKELWEQDDLDEDLLANKDPSQEEPQGYEQNNVGFEQQDPSCGYGVVERTNTELLRQRIPSASGVDWADFLASSTQLDRELSTDQEQPSKPRTTLSKKSSSMSSFPSFSSDELFDEENIAELDNAIQAVKAEAQMERDKLLMPPPPVLRNKRPDVQETAKGTMPPPPAPQPARNMLAPMRRTLPETKSSPVQPVRTMMPRPPRPIHPVTRPTTRSQPPRPFFRPLCPPGPLQDAGITSADLEALASHEIVLSQFPGG